MESRDQCLMFLCVYESRRFCSLFTPIKTIMIFRGFSQYFFSELTYNITDVCTIYISWSVCLLVSPIICPKLCYGDQEQVYETIAVYDKISFLKLQLSPSILFTKRKLIYWISWFRKQNWAQSARLYLKNEPSWLSSWFFCLL